MQYKWQANKYKARKATTGGQTFDSKKEARRYLELKVLERMGKISQLETQRAFELIPTQREPSTYTKTGKERPGKVLERSVVYIADFSYIQDGERVVSYFL